jgi:hypothetical protein
MDVDRVSAIQRTPQEIWWMILDEAIDVPLLFATTYEGSDWSRDAHICTHEEQDALYFDSEKQRKVISCVCRTWRIFALSRVNRQILLLNHSSWLIETGPKARHVTLWDPKLNSSSLALEQGATLEWEVVRAYNSSLMKEFTSATLLPRLRRLQLWFYDGDPRFSDLLRSFPNITWLDCLASFFFEFPTPELDKLALPNLQVLRYECEDTFIFPLSGILLPSLRYLYIRFSIPITKIPLLDVLLFYSQSIGFVSIKSGAARKAQIIEFPSWDQFPRLKELDLDRSWAVHFDPLPPSHPLQKLSANHATFDAIPSLLEGRNMRKLTLQKTRWTTTGELVGRTVMDAERATVLWERAKARGVKFEVTQKGRKFQDRDKVLATASRVASGYDSQRSSLYASINI